MPGAIISGLSSEDISYKITQHRAKVGPGSGTTTNAELHVMGNQMLVYYDHWDVLSAAVKRDLDALFHLWGEKIRETRTSPQLSNLEGIISMKQLQLPRD